MHPFSLGLCFSVTLVQWLIVVVLLTDSTEEGSDEFGSEGEDDESEDRWDELSDDQVEIMDSEDASSS